MKLVGRKFPHLVERNRKVLSAEEDEELEKGESKKAARDEPEDRSGLAFVLELERKTMEVGPGAGVWIEAAGGPEVKDDEVAVLPGWTARAAALSDVAVLLSSSPMYLIETAGRIREAAAELERRRPLVLVGTFKDDQTEQLDALAGSGVDGVILEHRDLGEPELEAEFLRRAAANLGEKLMLDRGSWTYAPAIGVTGRLDVLLLLPSTLAEFVLLDSPPREKKQAPAGRLIVTDFPETRTWWSEDFLVAGPRRLVWSRWARDPRVPPR